MFFSLRRHMTNPGAAKMPLNTRMKFMGFPLKTLSAAVVSALLFSNADAAGFGNLTVLSSLGQPLHAEIELISTTKDETGQLVARLAPIEAFRQADVEFNPALFSLRFTIVSRGDKQFVRVTSVRPMNEPFVNMLLELSSSGGSGRMVREYIFLLDPADLGGIQTAQASAPGNNITLQASPSQVQQQQPQQPQQQQVVAPSSPAPNAMPASKAIVPNKPAQQSALQSVQQPVQQSVPQPVKSAPVSQTAAPAPVKANTDSGEHKITNKAAPHAPAPAGGKARLKLSNVTGGTGADKVLTMEDRVSMEKAIAESNERVKALEQKMYDLQKLLEVTNSLLAEMRKQADAAKGDAKLAVPAAPTAASNAVAEAKPAEEKKDAPAAAPAVPVAPAPVAAPKPIPAAAAPVPESSMVRDLFALLAGVLLSALGGLGIYTIRRRKEKKSSDDSIAIDSSLATNSASDSTGAQSIDVGSVFNSRFSSSDSELDTSLDDTMAEVDVFIAYGRDVQAEEILKEALRTHPEHIPVRVKMLGIYAARKDLRSFEPLARELHSMTKGEGEEWMQVATMGIAIDPDNPLYAGGQSPENAAARDGAVTASSEQPAVHGLEDLLIMTLVESEEQDAGSLAPESSDLVAAIAAEAPPQQPEAIDAPLVELISADDLNLAGTDSAPNDLDFDLNGMDVGEVAVPTIPDEPPSEPPAGTGPIDFDFNLPEIPAIGKPEDSATPPPEAAAAAKDAGVR